MAFAPPPGFSAAQVAEYETLKASQAARLAALLALYTDKTRAARFERTGRRERSDLASNARELQRLHPQLQRAVNELLAAQRSRTLLNLLVHLEHYERVGRARGEVPPGPDYWRAAVSTMRVRTSCLRARCWCLTMPAWRTWSRMYWTSCAASGMCWALPPA
jgi:hypothetical protein